MKKILLTGANGTIGQVLKKELEYLNFEVFCWDRDKIPIDDYYKMKFFIEKINPDVIYHLAAITSFDENLRFDSWNVNFEWPSEIAWICYLLDIKFVFLSTAMVFSNNFIGPIRENSLPDANAGYGYEKLRAEEQVFRQNVNSLVVRLGFQIAKNGKNSMIYHIQNEIDNKGVFYASSNFYPACSFVEDTAKFLIDCMNFDSGIYMFDSNKKWNFYQIVCGLKKYLNKDWNVEEVFDFKLDQRMQDNKIKPILLSNKLDDLK